MLFQNKIGGSVIHRNQSFAYLFKKLKLAQAEGQGISTIIRTMREEGCPDPIFEVEEENAACILPANPNLIKCA